MPIAASDLIALGSLSRPEDDTSTSGGAIDIDHRPEFTALTVNDQVEAVSSDGGDTTQQVTVYGRDATGAKVSDTKTLSGATPVVFTPTFERITKVVMDSDAAGTVTIRRDGAAGDLGTIPPGERGFYRMFLDSASESSQAVRYEKLFWKNAHGSLTLNTAAVELTADPDSKIEIGLATAKDDSGSVANRKSAPGGITFVDDSVSQSVPGNTLAAGEGIGVWIKQTLAADNAPLKSSFTSQLSGTSV